MKRKNKCHSCPATLCRVNSSRNPYLLHRDNPYKKGYYLIKEIATLCQHATRARNDIPILIIIFFFFSFPLFFLSSCGGGKSNSTSPNSVSQTKTGSITFTFRIPSPPQALIPFSPPLKKGEYKEDSLEIATPSARNDKWGIVQGDSSNSTKRHSPLIPFSTKSISVTISGEGLTTPLYKTATPSGGIATIIFTNVPIGIKTAEIQALDSSNNIVAHRIVSAVIEENKTETSEIELGVSITDSGFVPQEIVVFPGDILVWVNNTYVTHYIMANDASFHSDDIYSLNSYNHVFDQNGTYDYKCVFTNKTGKVIVAGLTINPSANPTYGAPPLTVNFSSNTTCYGGTISSYDWNFGDGSTSASTSISHTYQSVGTYTVTFTANCTIGKSESTNLKVTVSSSPVNTNPPKFILKWGSYGKGNGQFYSSRDVAVDNEDNVYVQTLHYTKYKNLQAMVLS